MFDIELEHLIRRHGSPALQISTDPILMRIIVEGETTAELQKDLAWHYRCAKPGYTVMFDRNLVKGKAC